MALPEQRAAVEVAVAAPIDKTLTYLVPDGMQPALQVGSRVEVPLGRRLAVGYVMSHASVDPAGMKEIRALLDPAPLFHAAQAEFYRRAASYYAHPIGEVVRTALPAGLSGRGKQPPVLTEKVYRFTGKEGQPSGAKQQSILTRLQERESASLSELRESFPSPHAVLARLVDLGYLSVEDVERCRDPFAGTTISEHVSVEANAEQLDVLAQITGSIEALPGFAPFLLHGVTGSGKTEVYLRAIAATLKMKKQALMMVPEIALTPQLVGRFRSWFQGQSVSLAVLHSGLSDGERYDAWRQVARGEMDVVIGARSSIFAPLPRLGLIVVDEEHDASYKQGEAFRYNARDLALMRGQMEETVVLLGSATPALTSYQRAVDRHVVHLELPERIAERPLPEVTLVDMKTEERDALLSSDLSAAIEATLAAGEQSLLLLNRRGYAPYLLCQDCGATLRCPNCAITLTFSQVERSLRCHYCDYRQAPPDTCEQCDGQQVQPEGIGTERLEEEVKNLFPSARVVRMDRDTTGRKGSHARLVEQMMGGEIDILIGTQMIAKGHDFPSVTLVGVLNADSALNLPDFRSAERVFALLSQVAGRAGRGERPGRVLIQTYDPEHYALAFVVHHDYRQFAEMELAQRQALAYPPFGHLVNLVLAGNDEARVLSAAEQLAASLSGQARSAEVLGPAPCLLQKLRGKHRMQILLKAETRPPLRALVERLRQDRKVVPAGVALSIDVDPLDMF